MLSKLDITKAAITFVVGSGTTTIVNSIIKNNANPEDLYHKVTVGVSSLVIGTMAADATKKYTDAKIDEAVAWWTTRQDNKAKTN